MKLGVFQSGWNAMPIGGQLQSHLPVKSIVVGVMKPLRVQFLIAPSVLLRRLASSLVVISCADLSWSGHGSCILPSVLHLRHEQHT
ncbi:MAG: hypothetical protein KatS3mg015_2877 [Fimbriimonadales bacterium]|nr:MAG: hypothetical protein KatS3mg015_2877 [Fimbriimonadales bacterium]